MSPFAGTAFGIPTISPMAQTLAGPGSYVGHGIGMQAFPQQLYGQTLSTPFIGGATGIGPYGPGTTPWLPLQQVTPLQQIGQLLQILPQQLQQVQLLQQQQLVQLQQLLQWVPAQLQQLQQLIQVLPHQVQQLQQAQPVISGPLAFGLVPQPVAGQASHVM